MWLCLVPHFKSYPLIVKYIKYSTQRTIGQTIPDKGSPLKAVILKGLISANKKVKQKGWEELSKCSIDINDHNLLEKQLSNLCQLDQGHEIVIQEIL